MAEIISTNIFKLLETILNLYLKANTRITAVTLCQVLKVYVVSGIVGRLRTPIIIESAF